MASVSVRLPRMIDSVWCTEMSLRAESMASNASRLKWRKQRIAELETVVERQASEIDHLVKQLQRARPKRPKMSATRSIWIAGKQSFKCAGDRSICPCWLLRDGTFGPEGWQIDHIQRWSVGYDDRETNLNAKCATCHFRTTKEQIMGAHNDDEEEEEEE